MSELNKKYELCDFYKEFREKSIDLLSKDLIKAKSGDKSVRDSFMFASPDVMPSRVVGYCKKKKIPLKGMASFRRSVSMRHFANSLVPGGREWALNSKKKGHYFADRLGIPRPRTIAIGPLNEIKHYLGEDVVLKPKGGSGGHNVFIFRSGDEVFDIAKKKTIKASYVIDSLNNSIVNNKVRDVWIVEELVHANNKPASDLKFYCFYGVCGLVLEIKREPKTKYCFWLPNGESIDTGQYSNSLFEGESLLPSQIELAEFVSSRIPVPFMRIDFIRTDSNKAGMVFGEFTPSPGDYEKFNDNVDQYLGEMYLSAELRLNDDLLNFKEFDDFKITRDVAVD